MTDVVFVTPNFGGWVKDEPVGTLLLATIVRNAGIPVDVLQFRHFGDAEHFESFISSAVEQILGKNPKIVFMMFPRSLAPSMLSKGNPNTKVR